MELTPVQEVGDYLFKRDDLFEVAGVRGGKVRTCLALAQGAKVGLTTAGSRSSPQVNIVANIARHLGLPCVAHLPQGKLNREIEMAQEAGCKIIQHRAGYNSVIVARSRTFAKENGYTDIPFGMECEEAVKQTAAQVANIPAHVKRIVMPVGGGMSCAGVLQGLRDFGREDVLVFGVMVGATPFKRLMRYAPLGFQSQLRLREPNAKYSDYVDTPDWVGFKLDPVYEAKAVKFLQPGDLFWCVGIRQSMQ